MPSADAKDADPGIFPFKFLHPHILEALDALDYSTATFLSERLFYVYRPWKNQYSELSRLLLATCYFRSGKQNAVYSLLKTNTDEEKMPQSAYMFAQACFHLKKYSEAEKALLGKDQIHNVLNSSYSNIPLGCQGYYLLGRICRRTSRNEQSKQCFKRCLELNSLHWSAYKGLCDLGADVDSKTWFQSDAVPLDSPRYIEYLAAQGSKPQGILDNLRNTIASAFAEISASSLDKVSSSPYQISVDEGKNSTSEIAPIAPASILETPNTTGGSKLFQTPSTPNFVTPPGGQVKKPPQVNNKPVRKKRVESTVENRQLRRSTRLTFSGIKGADTDNTPQHHKTPRRSARLDSRKKARVYTSTKSGAKGSLVTPKPRDLGASVPSNQSLSTPSVGMAPIKRKLMSDTSGKPIREKTMFKSRNVNSSVPFTLDSKSPEAHLDRKQPTVGGKVDYGNLVNIASEKRAALQQVFKHMAVGYKLLCQFKCKEAVAQFDRLPQSDYNSGWVLCCVGQCHFEMVNYPKCVEIFRLARKTEPYRLDGFEYYSTSLWHLKNEVELSYLAQKAVEFDKLSALSWIVVGNCLSLQKEHDTALKFFRRAIQLDPNSAWAYTLSAHEFVANEDFEKALRGFRQAIGVNPRHYNAWYGMGNIYFRQEKYELAAYHFRRALKINPRNTVLYCYLGMVLHANNQFDLALEHLTRAEKLEPTNSLAKYQKANVYFSLQKYHHALDVLKEVKDFAPREASVHFLMGKIYKKLGNVNEAIMHFTTTLDLNPKDKNVVKSAIDKLHCGDTDSQSEEEF